MAIKVHTINNIKKELQYLSKEELVDHCLRLAKYKKENKELFNYLLFEADDEQSYISEIKDEIAESFEDINRDSMFYVKKTVRRIHRQTVRHIKYSGNKATEIDLLLYFCAQMKDCGIPFEVSKVMVNFYLRQVKTIEKTLSKLHEDVRFDYEEELEVVKAYGERIAVGY